MVFRIGWISMGGQLSCEFGEKPASITDSAGGRQTRRAASSAPPNVSCTDLVILSVSRNG